MKNMSITGRITLWYTILMLLIVSIIIVSLVFFSKNVIRENTTERLSKAIISAEKEIEYRDGVLKIDEKIERVSSGFYISVYDTYGNILKGQVPRTFDIDTSFGESLNRIKLPTGEEYYYYDEMVYVEGYGNLWVRAITSYLNAQEAISGIVRTGIFILPIFTLFIILGGYYITRKALRPIEEIRTSVEEITAGSDLNKRLNLVGRKDEIYFLAETFDSMLDRLEDSLERERQFSDDISHELRTPTTIIRLKAESLLENEDLEEEDRNNLEIILGQSEKMSRLISQMLLITRTEKGKYEIENEEIYLDELLGIIFEELEDLADEKNIRLEKDIPKDLCIRGDMGLVIQIFNNLITNGINYGRYGGNIWIRARDMNEKVEIEILDDGIGISDDNIDRIWSRLFQVDKARNDEGAGSGLGLSIVKWACEIMKWKIHVDSEINRGTSFTLRINKF